MSGISKCVVVDKIANLFSVTATWETTGDPSALLKELPQDIQAMAVDLVSEKLRDDKFMEEHSVEPSESPKE